MEWQGAYVQLLQEFRWNNDVAITCMSQLAIRLNIAMPEGGLVNIKAVDEWKLALGRFKGIIDQLNKATPRGSRFAQPM